MYYNSRCPVKQQDVYYYFRKVVKMDREKKVKIMKRSLVLGIGAALIIYFGFTIYFTKHFYFGSYINDINYGGKTVEQVEKSIARHIDAYVLTIEEKDAKKETINSDDIDLIYIPDGTIQDLKDSQNPFAWIVGCFKRETHDMAVTVDYSKKALTKQIDQLDCLDEDKVVSPENAHAEYVDDKFVIQKEVYGDKPNEKKLRQLIKKAVRHGDKVLNLEEKKCYIEPAIKSDNEKLIQAVSTMNQYLKTKVTYDFEDRTEVVDGSIIKDWLVVDDKFNVEIDDQKITEYIKTLESKYNTLGKPRQFTTTGKKVISVPSGNYGWMIRRADEKAALIENVKKGETVKREPMYGIRGYVRATDDIGDTYIEISLSKQYMWFYKNGKVFVKTPIVTGNLSRNFGTPAGVYAITYKERNATLVGEGYSSPVNYWMPFNGNIGIHDASWRDKFGGEIYKVSGSHGCVNTPPKNAKKIFENIEKGMPVIVY